jgi:hypothetical protein
VLAKANLIEIGFVASLLAMTISGIVIASPLNARARRRRQENLFFVKKKEIATPER